MSFVLFLQTFIVYCLDAYINLLYAVYELRKVNAYCDLIIHSMTTFVLLRF